MLWGVMAVLSTASGSSELVESAASVVPEEVVGAGVGEVVGAVAAGATEGVGAVAGVAEAVALLVPAASTGALESPPVEAELSELG